MEADGGNLQNEFFNAVRRDRTLVTVFLTNGKKLVGRIRAFDKFTLLLDGPYGEQVVYKHAISTVSHARHGSPGDEGHAGPAGSAGPREGE